MTGANHMLLLSPLNHRLGHGTCLLSYSGLQSEMMHVLLPNLCPASLRECSCTRREIISHLWVIYILFLVAFFFFFFFLWVGGVTSVLHEMKRERERWRTLLTIIGIYDGKGT
jgi:amino acid transporter